MTLVIERNAAIFSIFERFSPKWLDIRCSNELGVRVGRGFEVLNGLKIYAEEAPK